MYICINFKKLLLAVSCSALAVIILSVTIAANLSRPAAVLPDAADKVQLPIIMYHSILNNAARSGNYVITPKMLEEDFKYVKEHGFTPITVNELIGYVYEDKKLPEKPIMITFDDGFMNNYSCAFPLLKEYGFKAVISCIGKLTVTESIKSDYNDNYSYMTWTQMKEMHESGLVEFQNHSYDLHDTKKGRNGALKKRRESAEDYEIFLINDINTSQTLMKAHLGITPSAYVYPFGAFSAQSEEIIKKAGFKSTLICTAVINYIGRDPECLYKLGRFNRPAGISTERFFSKILAKYIEPTVKDRKE